MQDRVKREVTKLSRSLRSNRIRSTIDWSNPNKRKERWIEKNINFIMKLIPTFPLISFMEHYEKGERQAKNLMEKISSARLRKENYSKDYWMKATTVKEEKRQRIKKEKKI